LFTERDGKLSSLFGPVWRESSLVPRTFVETSELPLWEQILMKYQGLRLRAM